MPFPDTPLRTSARRRVVLTRHLQSGFPPIAYRAGVEGEPHAFSSWRYAAAWRFARQRARDLQVALEDRCIEPAAFRESAHIDEPLWKRLQRTGGTWEPAGDPPVEARGRWVRSVQGGWMGHVPPTGLTRAQLWTQIALVSVLVALTTVVVALALDADPVTAPRVALAVIAGALPALPALGLAAVLVHGLAERHTVHVAPDGLFITRTLGPFTSESSIAWEDVEDLVITHDPVGADGTLFRLPGPAVLVVRMAARHVIVGDGLLPQELIWLRSAIVAMLPTG